MSNTLAASFTRSFLGHSPEWFKYTIIGFLVLNPIFFSIDPFWASWALVLEFIFCLAMALKCYPLQSGGLLALEALFIGMTDVHTVVHELEGAFQVILLLIFMVAGIYFMRDLLLFTFTKLLLRVRSRLALSLLFCFVAAFLSAFLDALTVTAVIITICVGFYSVYHKVASGKKLHHVGHDHGTDEEIHEFHREDLESFRGFLRGLIMHAAVGTALGGVCTTVGEPQNLLIADKAHWLFVEFFFRMAPVTIPVLILGLLTCVALELTGWFGYGIKLSPKVREVLGEYEKYEDEKRTTKQKVLLFIQALTGIWLITALSLQLAEPGLVGLSVIVLATAFAGVTEEHQLGKAFEEALPFTALLAVFFAIVAVIASQNLFGPIINLLLEQDADARLISFFFANGFLSMISDNVFVATVYINESIAAFHNGTLTRDEFDLLAVAINTGTNLPSVATPNGQAAFLFLLTSAIAPLIRLSYLRMVWMALPYTLVLTIVGYLSVAYVLEPATDSMYEHGLINHHVPVEKVQTGSGGH